MQQPSSQESISLQLYQPFYAPTGLMSINRINVPRDQDHITPPSRHKHLAKIIAVAIKYAR